MNNNYDHFKLTKQIMIRNDFSSINWMYQPMLTLGSITVSYLSIVCCQFFIYRVPVSYMWNAFNVFHEDILVYIFLLCFVTHISFGEPGIVELNYDILNVKCICSIKIISMWQLQTDLSWRYQMGTFSAIPTLCVGNSPVAGDFPSQRLVTRSFVIF